MRGRYSVRVGANAGRTFARRLKGQPHRTMATQFSRQFNLRVARIALCVVVLAWTASAAVAQQSAPPANPAPAPTAQERPGFFGSIGAWFDRQTAEWRAAWQGMGRQMQDFGREATAAARTGVDNAKQAAGAVGKLRTTVVAGNEKCTIAPTGAPDCVAAARAMCKAKGFESGQSLDMTTAEDCPAKVYLSGRNTGPECGTVTFVSRALCQ